MMRALKATKAHNTKNGKKTKLIVVKLVHYSCTNTAALNSVDSVADDEEGLKFLHTCRETSEKNRKMTRTELDVS